SAAAVPMVGCGVAAGLMLAAGDHRMLQVSAELPLVMLVGGAALSGVAMTVLGVRAARRRRAAALESARTTAAEAGAQAEREQHRRFLARLDHELKNPIMAIRATAAAADDAPEWGAVDAQAAKLSTLVRDLRKLAELETRALE